MSVIYKKGTTLEVQYKSDLYIGELSSEVVSNDSMMLLRLNKPVNKFREGDVVILPITSKVTTI